MFTEIPHNTTHKAGWIEVICGSMFSGKTEELIRRLKRAGIAKQKMAIFKPSIDLRYSNEHVVSHDSNAIKSLPINKSSEILELYTDEKVVGIDEAQFFDADLPQVCTALAANGVRVIVAGLDMDFKGKPFGPMPHIMAMAEYVTKVHAICVHCGNPAHFSHRLVHSENLVELGEKDIYEPLCRNCYIKATDQA